MSKYLVGEDLVIDSTLRIVSKNGIELNLPELSYRLLLTLIENSPQIVSHDELISAVWQERVVSDENLKKRVSRLREALGDVSDAPKYFVVERGMGYRCIAVVKKLAETVTDENTTVNKAVSDPTVASPAIVSASNKPKFNYYTVAAIVMVLGAVLFFAFLVGDKSASTKEQEVDSVADDYAFQAAQYYYRFNETDNGKALELYKQSIDADPSISSTYSGLANVYAQGYYQFGKGESWLQQAIDLSKQAIELDSEQAWGHSSLGLSLYLSGHFAESITAYNKASELAPNWGVPIAYRALVHLEMGDVTLACKTARKAVDKSPTNPTVTTILGLCYQEQSLVEKAKAIFENSLQNNADFLLARIFLAELFIVAGDYTQASDLLKTVIAESPNYQTAHWLLAQLHLLTGDTELALKRFESAALLGGRYSLSAQVYVAVIKKDRHQLQYLKQQVENKIAHGNQWAELAFSTALISLANSEESHVLDEFQQAIDSGFSHEYRFNNLSVLSTFTTAPKFKKLVEKLASRNKNKQLKRVPRK